MVLIKNPPASTDVLSPIKNQLTQADTTSSNDSGLHTTTSEFTVAPIRTTPVITYRCYCQHSAQFITYFNVLSNIVAYLRGRTTSAQSTIIVIMYTHKKSSGHQYSFLEDPLRRLEIFIHDMSAYTMKCKTDFDQRQKQLEQTYPKKVPQLVEYLQSAMLHYFGDQGWFVQLDSELQQQLLRRRGWNGWSVCHLLYAMSTCTMFDVTGTLPWNDMEYWLTKFPFVVVGCYDAILKFLPMPTPVGGLQKTERNLFPNIAQQVLFHGAESSDPMLPCDPPRELRAQNVVKLTKSSVLCSPINTFTSDYPVGREISSLVNCKQFDKCLSSKTDQITDITKNNPVQTISPTETGQVEQVAENDSIDPEMDLIDEYIMIK